MKDDESDSFADVLKAQIAQSRILSMGSLRTILSEATREYAPERKAARELQLALDNIWDDLKEAMSPRFKAYILESLENIWYFSFAEDIEEQRSDTDWKSDLHIGSVVSDALCKRGKFGEILKVLPWEEMLKFVREQLKHTNYETVLQELVKAKKITFRNGLYFLPDLISGSKKQVTARIQRKSQIFRDEGQILDIWMDKINEAIKQVNKVRRLGGVFSNHLDRSKEIGTWGEGKVVSRLQVQTASMTRHVEARNQYFRVLRGRTFNNPRKFRVMAEVSIDSSGLPTKVKAALGVRKGCQWLHIWKYSG